VYSGHKRFLGRGIAEWRVFFHEFAEKIRQSVSTVFNKNVDVQPQKVYFKPLKILKFFKAASSYMSIYFTLVLKYYVDNYFNVNFSKSIEDRAINQKLHYQNFITLV